MRKWYEVRIREKDSSGHDIKKSKYYLEKGPGDARRKYKGKGQIMRVEKVSREQVLGIGEFFKLGDQIMRELKSEESLVSKVERKSTKLNPKLKRGF